ncbi:ATP-binding protein [Niveibacterium sp. 24ML]|uniref:ATP-binding protein n=1 Tax=Niveibacterium sp. 24ML TaxID=2985512 RepID=UPI0022721F88|nr:ATP-binding protein [Niveibacterium sp. 24ML]MCX9157400.1 ATP-binding protein [Niveibacterium sp. 24ML]
MNAPRAPLAFADVAPGAANHARLFFFGAVLAWLAPALRKAGSPDALFAQHPFLQDYLDQIDRPELEGLPLETCWQVWHEATAAWAAPQFSLPIRRLQHALGLGDAAIGLVFQVGLIEDDPRFAALAADLQDGAARPAWGWLSACHPTLDPDAVRERLQQVLKAGLLLAEQQGPRAAWPLAVPLAVWDALCARPVQDPALRLREPTQARALEGLVAPPGVADLPKPLALRGLPGCGRMSLAAALAAQGGHGCLSLRAGAATSLTDLDSARCVALLSNAALVLDARHSLPDALPRLVTKADYTLLPVAGGELPAQVTLLPLRPPTPAQRVAILHEAWLAAGRDDCPAALALPHRLPAGVWRRQIERALTRPEPAHALAEQLAHRGDAALAALAEVLPTTGSWRELALPARATEEMGWLELRCRRREALADGVGEALAAGLTPGVRALFKGPSGTGKTAAARILAAQLGKPAYRIDLARTVSKYIGETEANLARIFEAAEAIDAVLLLDEGDALMAGRTGVSNANDRYANLETNFLLQAVERFHGILLITTNSAERIDSAFLRRIDVTIDFPAPDAAVRERILAIQLPADHAVPAAVLSRFAARCALSGGQWRNVVLHAALLALDAGGVIDAAALESAIRREYRKSGQVCPLREGGET